MRVGRMGWGVTAVNISRLRASVKILRVPSMRPSSSWTFTQAARSCTFTWMPAAAAAASSRSGATGRTIPSTGAWGVASSAEARNTGVAEAMPRGWKIRSSTRVSQLLPPRAAATSPAAM